MESDNEQIQHLLWKLHNVMRGEAMFIREDRFKTPEQKLEEMKVIEQFVKFLDNYDECKRVLDAHFQRKAEIMRDYLSTQRGLEKLKQKKQAQESER